KSTISASIGNDLTQGKYMQLRDSIVPMLALDQPEKVEANMIRTHDDIDVVRCPRAFHSFVCSCIETDTTEELSSFFLVIAPVRHDPILAESYAYDRICPSLVPSPSSSQAPSPREQMPGLGWQSHREATPGGRP